MIRKAAFIVAALAALLATYGIAGLLGGAIPTNRDWREAQGGVRIYVEDNGIHTGIVMPARAGGVDWDAAAPAAALRDPRYAGHGWRSVGWGDRGFYIGTPTWADVNPLTILRAATGGGPTVMHVDFVPEPRVGADVRSVVLSPDEYRRLASFIAGSFAERGERRAGYGASDAFYGARGRYSALRTCNSWTGEALRMAGVRMGAWTPFPVTVMWWLPSR